MIWHARVFRHMPWPAAAQGTVSRGAGVPQPFKTRVEITFGGAIIAESGPGPAAWLANWAGWRAELGNLAGWRKKVIISHIL